MKPTVLFPVKCDPVHIGHVMQIKELLLNGYDVTVDLLNSENRVQSIIDVHEILKIIFDNQVTFRIHSISYAKVVPKYLMNYDYLATGNRDIISAINLSGASIQVIPLQRIKGYRASKMREMYEEET
ncbi:MAG: hypothetical protein R6U65_10630 [Perlabentimonas sp.]